MKKIFLPFIAIAIMTFFVACSNEELLPEAIGEAEANTETTIEETRTLSITATMPGDEDPKTRVTLERDGLDIVLKWQEEGDRLQFAFVQGEIKVKSHTELDGKVSNNGKTVTFDINVPDGIDAAQSFDLYGLYSNYRDTDGLPNGISVDNPTNVILTRNPGSIDNTLGAVETRGDVMLYFKETEISLSNPLTRVTFKHLGSLFAISLRNTSTNDDLVDVKELRLQGVGGGTDENWAYNSGAGGLIFDLENEEFQNKETSGTFISFTPPEDQTTLPAEATATLWAWYPPLPDINWPELKLDIKDQNDLLLGTSANSKPARTEPTPAGRVFHFYAVWDGTNLNFTNDQFEVPTP